MIDKAINKCFVCGLWLFETDLEQIKIPDQAGYVKKPICKRCIRDIEGRSTEAGQADNKPPKLLMEG